MSVNIRYFLESDSLTEGETAYRTRIYKTLGADYDYMSVSAKAAANHAAHFAAKAKPVLSPEEKKARQRAAGAKAQLTAKANILAAVNALLIDA